MKGADGAAWDALSAELDGLQRTAAAGFAPGELRPWCEPLVECLEDVVAAFGRYVEWEAALGHRVLRDDLELARRVDLLREDLDSLEDELIVVRRRVERLLERDALGPHSGDEPTERLRALRRRTLHWIVDVRAHHGDAILLLVEAVHRDRGVSD